MASSATLANVQDRFPAGTTVGAYKVSDWGVSAFQNRAGVAPPGSAVATAVVAAGSGALAFTGLVEDTNYVTGAQVASVWRYGPQFSPVTGSPSPPFTRPQQFTDPTDATHTFTLGPRVSTLLSFPVAAYEPSAAAQVMAVDVAPSAGAVADANNGFAWNDICNATVRAVENPGVSTLRLGAFATHVEVGSRGYGGQNPLDMWLGPGQDGSSAPMVKLNYGGGGVGSVQLGADGANLVMGDGTQATNATNGYLYLTAVAGTPTGTPVFSGAAWGVLVPDSTAHKLWMHDGSGWKSVTFT